jgi:hypothetical protein
MTPKPEREIKRLIRRLRAAEDALRSYQHAVRVYSGAADFSAREVKDARKALHDAYRAATEGASDDA